MTEQEFTSEEIIASARAHVHAMYEACRDAIDQYERGGLFPPKEYFEHRLNTFGHAYEIIGLSDIFAQHDSLTGVLALADDLAAATTAIAQVSGTPGDHRPSERMDCTVAATAEEWGDLAHALCEYDRARAQHADEYGSVS